jgi:DNA-binding HxlR family transcriptional regulator
MRKAPVMHNEAFNKYLDEIPAEIRDAVSELSSPQRWAVFLAVLKEDRNFNVLRRELDISAEQLDNILRRLVIGGLVYKEMASPSEIGDRKKTRYTITPSGKNLVRSLLEGFLPEARSPAVKKMYPAYDLQKDEGMVVYEAGTGHQLAIAHKEPAYSESRKSKISYRERKPAFIRNIDHDGEKIRKTSGKRAVKISR